MRVLHLVPAAFDYYDDIRNRVNGWLAYLPEFGIMAEVITIHYGTSAQGMKKQTSDEAPKSRFMGRVETDEVVNDWSNYDIVHWHCPFIGGAKHFLGAVLAHPETPLIVTVHRLPRCGDVLELIMYWYNRYWLNKILKVATAVALVDPNDAVKKWVTKAANDVKKVYILDPATVGDSGKLVPRTVAEHLAMLYNTVVRHP